MRNRLRRDGDKVETDAVNDALQSIRQVRAYAKEWNIDPAKIGIMGFSAGAELAASAAVLFEDFDKKNGAANDVNTRAAPARGPARQSARPTRPGRSSLTG